MFKTLFLIVVSLLLISCGPAKVERFEEIKPHETAFLIPLEGMETSAQKRVLSESYLKSRMVSAKRISIPLRKMVTGRGPGAYKWIPTMKVIKVDRTPITREWTASPKTGTSTKDDAILVESLDSIAFRIGINIGVSIKPEDSARFLYNFNGKNMIQIVDNNVRGLVQSILSREFNKYDLTEAKKRKKDVIDVAFSEVKEYFSKKGLTIDYLGIASGMIYEDKEIQEAINKKFIAENEKDIVLNQIETQKELNKVELEKAQNQIMIAKKYEKNMQSILQLKKLEIAERKLKLLDKFLDRWDGKLPANMMPNYLPIDLKELKGVVSGQ